jgi:hypothetical protein
MGCIELLQLFNFILLVFEIWSSKLTCDISKECYQIPTLHLVLPMDCLNPHISFQISTCCWYSPWSQWSIAKTTAAGRWYHRQQRRLQWLDQSITWLYTSNKSHCNSPLPFPYALFNIHTHPRPPQTNCDRLKWYSLIRKCETRWFAFSSSLKMVSSSGTTLELSKQRIHDLFVILYQVFHRFRKALVKRFTWSSQDHPNTRILSQNHLHS